MRVLLGLAVIATLICLVWFAVLVYKAQQRKRQRVLEYEWAYAVRNARWEDYIRANEYETKVIVRKVARLSTGEEREVESQIVKTLSSDDPEWDRKYASAMVEAANRAQSLNIGSLS